MSGCWFFFLVGDPNEKNMCRTQKNVHRVWGDRTHSEYERVSLLADIASCGRSVGNARVSAIRRASSVYYYFCSNWRLSSTCTTSCCCFCLRFHRRHGRHHRWRQRWQHTKPAITQLPETCTESKSQEWSSHTSWARIPISCRACVCMCAWTCVRYLGLPLRLRVCLFHCTSCAQEYFWSIIPRDSRMGIWEFNRAEQIAYTRVYIWYVFVCAVEYYTKKKHNFPCYQWSNTQIRDMHVMLQRVVQLIRLAECACYLLSVFKYGKKHWQFIRNHPQHYSFDVVGSRAALNGGKTIRHPIFVMHTNLRIEFRSGCLSIFGNRSRRFFFLHSCLFALNLDLLCESSTKTMWAYIWVDGECAHQHHTPTNQYYVLVRVSYVHTSERVPNASDYSGV